MQNFIMRSRRDFFARAGLVLLFCLLAGCSALRIGYANGENLVYWWLDSYVDFQGDQKPWVRSHIRNLVAWHRKTQLNDYAQLLTQTQQRLQRADNRPVTPAEVLADYSAVKKRVLLAIDKALPELADLVLALQPQQVAHLEKKFAANNDAYRKDYLHGSLEDRQRFRFRKVMKQAEYWFGDFNAQQEAQIRAASDARPLDNELWMAERLRRQQELTRLLQRIQAEKPDRDAVMAMLRAHAAAALDMFSYDENRAFFDASRASNAQMVALIVNIATSEQKVRAVKRLQKLIEDCNTLAAQ